MQEIESKAARLFLEHHRLVLDTAFRAAPLPGMAEDISQDVFTEFVTHAARWDLETNVAPLLVAITRNVALRYWKEHRKTLSPKLREIAEIMQREARQDNDDRNVEPLYALNICLEKLSVQSRRAIDLHYRDRLKTREIGERLSISANAVRISMFRIRNALRSCVQRLLDEEIDDD